ncbi:trypsin alpha [Drosophila kikkawai]|uniref:Trypsin alpha n=1 Tax=Drosophila kikkawai TaxID=30033 RepID=A0A6P4JTA5_DROKI|nr:trypsin alpha [Drosophila kikkawai]
MADPRIALGLLICVVLAAANAKPQGRILGGEDAAQGEFPWSVSVRVNKAHACSGCIISQNKILTAASCVSSVSTTPVDPSSVAVRVGSINQYAGGSIVSVESILIHPSYGNFLHNLALLTLSENLVYSDRIAAATLPSNESSGEETEEELPNGTPVYVAGWGEQSDGTAAYKLQKSNYNTLSDPWCELAAGYGYSHITCLSSAENEGICRGDTGAAVVDDNKVLRGITSFHFGECGSNFPDISTRVSYYLAWIEANAN